MTDAAQQPAKETQKPQTFPAKAFAAQSATSRLAPHSIKRRSPRPQDVQLEILYCGVCHSDLHQARNEWQHARHCLSCRGMKLLAGRKGRQRGEKLRKATSPRLAAW
jgi:hypothetical protein